MVHVMVPILVFRFSVRRIVEHRKFLWVLCVEERWTPGTFP